ncbi:hypothetical protein IQ264_18090 [Phormidium sp. LEGE 05292]|uniref:hypothetical protein n=1 Tax=[Phormidium] sp. LEGE 05292 TaxID=767427 RepID=UPI0018810F6E|nr:hypothetical protein [Phormidium sp. LEGE 05292]MBE9227341.1 hypothetical protein [Phormidium sp. LEGE 05292]
MEKRKAKNIILRVLGFSFAIAPALLIAILLLKNSVNVPFWDDWAVGVFLSRVFSELKLSVEQLISQHNESRYAFPRLIFIALAYLNNGKWNLTYQMWVSFALACLISINIFYLIKLTVRGKFLKVIFLTIICNSLIFAPIQYGNWLWGIQLIVFMPIACITTCLVVIYSGINRTAKLFICLILCTISTYSYANGMLSWVIIFPIFALSKSGKWRIVKEEKWLYVGWVTAFTANIVVYFNNYQKPLQTPSFIYALAHLDQTIKYFLSFLGAPLGWGTFKYVYLENFSLVNNNIIIGLGLIILFLGACVYFVWHRQEQVIIYRMTGWLTIGSYAVISGFVTSLGRVGLGLNTSIAERYTTFSVYLPLALICLAAIIYDDAKSRSYLEKHRQKIAQTGMFILLVVFLCLHILTSELAISQMYMFKLDRLQAKSCLAFINVLADEKCLTEKLYPNLQYLKQNVKIVNDKNLIDINFINNVKIQDIQGKMNISENGLGYGSFDKVSQDKDLYVAQGWARLLNKKQLADAVLLTYEKGKDEDIIFAISDTRVKRVDVVNATKNPEYSMSGWQKTFPTSKLPKGWVKIKAWAFDSETSQAYQLGGIHVVKN